MCMWHCGIHYPFHVDVSTRSTFVPEHPVSATQDCDSLGDLAILQCKSLMVSCQNLFRTPIEIRKLFGIILRLLPWNLCIKMYLRIGEAKNPGPTSGPRRKQLDTNGRAFQTVQFATANVVSMVDKAPWFNSFDHE